MILAANTKIELLEKEINMGTLKITREEAILRWKASRETKRKMVEKLERLVRDSCLERTGKQPAGVEIW